MQAGTDRRARDKNSRRERTTGKRLGRRMRWAALLAVCAATGLTAAPGQAMTGGAAAVAYDPTVPAGQDIAFGGMRSAGATWYGPGLYGNRTACGQILQPGTIGVAHRSLPCGTAVRFVHHGRSLVTRVIDRGPFTDGNAWDLTNGARLALSFEDAGRIRYAVPLHLARRR